MEALDDNAEFEGANYRYDAQREHLLTAIRCASLQYLLSKNEIDSVGVALRGKLIDINQALDWLEFLGALPLIYTVVERARG